MPGKLTSALFHQNQYDRACQVYWQGEGFEPGTVVPLRFVSFGRATFELYEKATNKVLQTLTAEFSPMVQNFNQPAPVPGTSYGARIPPPFNLPGLNPAPGQSVRMVGRPFYTGAFVLDLSSSMGATATVDPNYPPQDPL